MATVQTTIKLNDQFTSALKNMSKALNIMVSGLDSANRKTKTAFDPKSIQGMRSAMTQANVAIQNLTKSQDQFNRKVKESSSNVNSLWGKLKSIAGAYAGWQTVKSAVGASDKYANNTARLGLLTNGKAETADLQQKIYEASQRSLTNYGAMTDAVAKLGITAKQAFNSNDEIVRFTELLNKQFKVAGTGAQEQAAAMYQLTQAMAAGKLQGDEFRSILENAPMLAQSIAKEMGVLPGQLREMSSQGLITADVIKNALFSTAVEVNKMYEQLPMTFGGMWTQVINKINKGLEPLWKKIGKLWSSDKFQRFVDALTNGFLVIGHAVVGLMDVLSTVFNFVYNNWENIVAILIPAMVVGIWNMVTAAWAMVPPLVASAAAWLALNWPILLVGAAIGFVIAVAKYMGVTFGEICGFIVGSVSWAGSVIWNTFVGVIQGILKAIDSVANTIIGVVEWVLNVCNGGFNSFLGGVANLIGQICGWFLDLGTIVTTIIDAIFGTNWTSGLNSLANRVRSWGKNEAKAITLERNVLSNKASGLSRVSSKDWYNAGSNWATGAVNKMTSVSYPEFTTDTGILPATSGLGNVGTAMKNANAPLLDTLGNIDKNTAATASAVTMNNEDMTYLRDLAERQAINNISSKKVEVKMTNNNSIASTLDLDNIIDRIGEKVHNLAIMSAEGSHY